MSDQPVGGNAAADEADKAGATSEDFGNLSVEDDAEGTTDPTELDDNEQSPDE